MKTNTFNWALLWTIILIITLWVIIAKQVSAEETYDITPKTALQDYAKAYNVSYDQISKTVACESGWNHTAVGDGGKAYSYGQFHQPTFYRFAKLANLNLDYKNPNHQLQLMAWAFSKGHQSHWTCYTKLFGNAPVQKYGTIYKPTVNATTTSVVLAGTLDQPIGDITLAPTLFGGSLLTLMLATCIPKSKIYLFGKPKAKKLNSSHRKVSEIYKRYDDRHANGQFKRKIKYQVNGLRVSENEMYRMVK